MMTKEFEGWSVKMVNTKKVALVDVDEVLADFIQGLRNYGVIEGEVNQWDFRNNVPTTLKATTELVLRSEEFWLNLPRISGAKDGLAKLEQRGFDVVFVTSPYPGAYNWLESRQTWLKWRFDIEPKLHVTHEKFRVSGDLFIDDKIENVELWQKANPSGRAYLFDRAHNQDSNLPRMMGWKDLDRVLR